MFIVRLFVRLLVLAIIAAAIAYPAADWLREPLGETARAQLLAEGKAHRFVTLPQGVTHIWEFGPAEGPPVLMVHGLSNGGYVFEDLAAPLAAAGFHVIAIDRFGYGYSDRPAVPYTNEFFATQIKDLLTALNITRPVHILGYSLGGAVVTGFAAHARDKVQSLTLLAPAGLDGMARPAAYFSAPIIGDWLLHVWGPEISRRGVEPTFAKALHPEKLIASFRGQLRFRGYGDGLLSTARHFDWTQTLADYDGLGASGLPVLAIWGTADTTLPYVQSKALLRRVPQTKLVTLQGKEHSLGYTDAAEVAAALLPFVQEQEARFVAEQTAQVSGQK